VNEATDPHNVDVPRLSLCEVDGQSPARDESRAANITTMDGIFTESRREVETILVRLGLNVVQKGMIFKSVQKLCYQFFPK
jgi:hypothetical protein